MVNEKRLIDANALADKLQAHHDFFVNEWGGFSNLPIKDKARVDEITHCIAEVTNAPTVDAVEVLHGRWRLETDEEMPNPMFKLVVCSVCNEKANGTYNYCPNCGAKMDGDEE